AVREHGRQADFLVFLRKLCACDGLPLTHMQNMIVDELVPPTVAATADGLDRAVFENVEIGAVDQKHDDTEETNDDGGARPRRRGREFERDRANRRVEGARARARVRGGRRG
ncbi:MAG: hypothetical protein VXY81_14670, partial [Pseudomonadota bacterium]|nr:hypothetical protein [Pseudomonadota bacterium]